MTYHFARILFFMALFTMKRVIAKRMWNSPGYYNQTMCLIEDLFPAKRAFAWQARVTNLMLSYKENHYVR